jgi:hypothetical protein
MRRPVPVTLWVRARLSPPTRLGKPIRDWTAETLEVLRAISLPHPASPTLQVAGLTELPVLPTYVPRPHDTRLAEVVQAAAGGVSRVVMLVGGSSTGKTRAAWEASGVPQSGVRQARAGS